MRGEPGGREGGGEVGGHEWQGPATVLRTVMPDLATYSTLSSHPVFHLLCRLPAYVATSSSFDDFRWAYSQPPSAKHSPGAPSRPRHLR